MPAPKKATMLAAYAVIGGDERKQKSVVDRLKKHVAADFAMFNLDEISASADLEASVLLSSLNTFPLGADRRYVIVYNAEKLDKSAKDMLVDYLAHPNELCTVCLLFESLPKNTRLYKALAALGPHSIIDAVPKRNRALIEEIQRFAQAQHTSIEYPAAEELIKRSGESSRLLKNQIAQLAQLTQGQAFISYHDVVTHISQTAEIKPWDFLDPLCERNAQKTLTQYHLMAKPSQVALVAMLANRLRELICTQSLLAQGRASDLVSELHKHPYQINKYKLWVKNFAPGELAHFLCAAADCDRALKSGADADIAFTQLILEICGVVKSVSF